MRFAACLWACSALLADAQSYPQRPVRLIIPFPAATSPDVVMRIVGPIISEMWGQPMIIDNRTGASGNLGANAVATAAADGHTLLYTVNSVICANPHLFPKMPFDTGANALSGSFGKIVRDDHAKWGKVIRDANIKPE